MPRSPPPAAINSMAATMMAVTEVGKGSDLPLRNHPSTSDSAPQVQLPPTPIPTGEPPSRADTEPILSDRVFADTPSSTVVEFGYSCMSGASAAQRAEQLICSRSRSRSGTGEMTDSARSTPRGTGRSDSPSTAKSSSRSQSQSTRSPSASSHSTRSQSTHRVPVGRERGYSDKLDKFFQSMVQTPPVDPSGELVAENVSLHQRIAALQRTERDLLKESQEMKGRTRLFRQKYESRRVKWEEEAHKKEEEARKKDDEFKARVWELEARIARQEEEIAQLKIGQKDNGTIVSDEGIETWFSTRGLAWQLWAENFGHRDSSRLQRGLHPLQMSELCDGVKGFVRLTHKGALPEDLLAGAGTSGTNAAHILLHGMLSNFIITETLQSPFWVFGLLSGNAIELETPIVSQSSMSPVGFRMDLAMWNNVAPLRSARLPQPMAAVLGQPPTKGKQPPRLITTVQSLSIHTTGLANLAGQGMPARLDMENLFGLIKEVQQNDNDSQKCMSQLIRVLAEGGLNRALEDAKGEKRRILAEARKNYASKLKDRFLSGPARFLLHDQDAVGIMKLERRLLDEFDMALRFSCELWSRPHDSPVFKGLESLLATNFQTSSDLMTLCKAQDPTAINISSDQQLEQLDAGLMSPPPAYYDGQSVLMVLQPAMESVRSTVDNEGAVQKVTKIRAKAQVLLSAPQSTTPLTARPAPTDPNPVLSPSTMSMSATHQTTTQPLRVSTPRSAKGSPVAPPVPLKNLPVQSRQEMNSPTSMFFKLVSLERKA